jgi:probable O-glycosylation ligase (exosortase A-associated)
VRDLMILSAFLVMLPMAMTDGFVAFLLWGWSGLVALDQYTFGFAQSVRFNLIFALIALAWILADSAKRNSRLPFGRTGLFFLLWAVQATVSATLGYPNNPNNAALYEHLMKALLFAILMPLVVTSRFRIHALLIAIALALSFHGLLDGLKFLVTGGGHIVRGIQKFGDNNHFAVALVMSIPLIYYLFQYSRSRLVRLGALGSLTLTTLAVIGTRSRGGFVGLAIVGLVIALTSRKRWQGLLMVALGAGLVVLMAPDSWSERMNTIKSADQDGSFMQRVEAWQVSSAMALHNPLTGGGFHAVQTQPVWEQYRGQSGLLGFVDIGSPSRGFRAAHSIYFEVLGDTGFVGLAIFLGMLANIFITRTEIKRMVRLAGPSLHWAGDLSDALAASVAAFMVGGSTVSLAYNEVLYMFAMLMEILKQQVARDR